nr:hypothetical protein [Methylobacterium sp. L1A1]
MNCSEPDDAKRIRDGASSSGLDETNGTAPLSGKAQRTLDQIADALGVTTALLKQGDDAEVPSAGSKASLAEASALLQAFVRIEDPEVRRSLLARARDAAKRA